MSDARRRARERDREFHRLLAKACNVSTRTVREALRDGLELGLIERTDDGYMPTMPPDDDGGSEP